MPRSELPAYRVRRSARARHVRLKISFPDGLLVVIPKRFDERRLPGLLAEQRDWIERRLDELDAAMAAPEHRCALPETLDLLATGRRWSLTYVDTGSRRVRVDATGDDELRISGAVMDLDRTRAALRRWLAAQARVTMVEELDRLSARHGLRYERATIRFQRTRWGSCSSRGTISLNARLMFLRPALVRCVIAHELCHTAHLHHGRAFWALLDNVEPDHRALDSELRRSWNRIPAWTFA